MIELFGDIAPLTTPSIKNSYRLPPVAVYVTEVPSQITPVSFEVSAGVNSVMINSFGLTSGAVEVSKTMFPVEAPEVFRISRVESSIML